MTDEEFEKLLDELHGSGKGPSVEELEMATRPVASSPVSSDAKASAEASAPSTKPAANLLLRLRLNLLRSLQRQNLLWLKRNQQKLRLLLR